MGHHVELSYIIAVVEELNLLGGHLSARTVWEHIQISESGMDVLPGEVLTAGNNHTDPGGAVYVLHAGEHGLD
jgi:hypothetical protein